MAEVPEHLLKRSRERRKALGLPVEGDDGDETETPAAGAGESEPVEEVAAAASDAGEAITEDKGGVPRTCSSGRASARPRSRAVAAMPRRQPGGGATRTATAVAARADHHRARRSHAAPAHRRQVGLDPADARRSPGQGARLAAPARARVRIDPVADGVRHGLLGVGEGAVARPRRRERDTEPVEGAVVLPRSARAAEDVQPDGRRRVDSRHRARACSRSRRTSTRTRRTNRPIASSRSR